MSENYKYDLSDLLMIDQLRRAKMDDHFTQVILEAHPHYRKALEVLKINNA